MAVAEMSKLNLVAMSYDKDSVLNALQRTNAAEVKLHYEAENTVALTADCEEMREYLSNVENALNRLSSAIESYNKDNKIKSDVLKDGFDVSYSDFMSAKDMKWDMDALVEKVNLLYNGGKELSVELSKLKRTISSAEIYSTVKLPLKNSDTLHTKIRMGTLPANSKDSFISSFSDGLCAFSVLAENSDGVLISAAYHKSIGAEAESILQEAGFVPCPFDGESTGEEVFLGLKEREAEILNSLKQNSEETYALSNRIHDLKIYCDYLGFELEKQELAEKMRATQATVLIEAYVPKESEEQIKEVLEGTSKAVYYEFSSPADDEIPPTLLKNNKVVKNFEAVTNMYSPVSYREFDPNTVMALFYSLFLGFIMGDVGYGLLMSVLGGTVYFLSKRDTGLKRLAGVFAVGGIFAIIWGFLFNSLFGIQLPYKPPLPDAQGDMWQLMGIKIPAVLIISLLIGALQLCAGYVCKTVQCFRRKQIADGILDGMVWAFFTLGVGLAIVGLIDDFNVKILAYVGGIIAGVMLVTAMLTAGRKEKLLGKFTKGFGAAYGVINFASDVLSYARLYGLMLSGAVIAQIVSSYAIGFITGGNAALAILGVVLMVVGHVFNLAIGLLGAYIHDARLQYVEFYGRFYEGEGELFAPLGSKHKYIYLQN